MVCSEFRPINVDDHLCLRLATSIFCRSDSLQSKYLCMPLGANSSRISTWKPVIEKFCKRLHLWKERLLTMVGRLYLIKSVLNFLHIHFIFCVCIQHAKKGRQASFIHPKMFFMVRMYQTEIFLQDPMETSDAR
jgi:hypothetical protein